MATQKPISTISYNTLPFLIEKLDLWVAQHIIQAYQLIHHTGEDGDKDHTHVRIEPNKKLDPMELSEALREYELGNDKPLCVRPWRPSKEEDWFLYAVHNKEYLALKYGGGEKGEKLPYDWHDIKVSANYDLEVAWVRALASLQHSTVNMATRLKQGANPLELVLQGENVFTVNAIARSLYTNDYQRLQGDYEELCHRFHELMEAVKDAGLVPDRDENEKLVLLPDIDE